MFHSSHSANNNTEIQSETKCQFDQTRLKPSCHLSFTINGICIRLQDLTWDVYLFCTSLAASGGFGGVSTPAFGQSTFGQL